jgi:hypothetical protein
VRDSEGVVLNTADSATEAKAAGFPQARSVLRVCLYGYKTVSHVGIAGSLIMKDLNANDNRKTVRPKIVREIALWWQSELDRAALVEEAPEPPSNEEVMLRFQCTEEEALRGVGLGEHRHFSGSE